MHASINILHFMARLRIKKNICCMLMVGMIIVRLNNNNLIKNSRRRCQVKNRIHFYMRKNNNRFKNSLVNSHYNNNKLEIKITANGCNIEPFDRKIKKWTNKEWSANLQIIFKTLSKPKHKQNHFCEESNNWHMWSTKADQTNWNLSEI